MILLELTSKDPLRQYLGIGLKAVRLFAICLRNRLEFFLRTSVGVCVEFFFRFRFRGSLNVLCLFCAGFYGLLGVLAIAFGLYRLAGFNSIHGWSYIAGSFSGR